VADYKAISLLGGRHSHRFGSNDEPRCRRRRNRQLVEEGCSDLLSQRVWVNLMGNGGYEGVCPVTTSQVEIATVHKVQLSRRQRRIRAKPSSRSSASIQGVNLEPKVQVSTSGFEGEIWIGWSNIEQALLDNTVAQIVGHIIEEPQDTIWIDPAICSLLCPILVPHLFPVLTTGSLKSEKPISALVSLDMILWSLLSEHHHS